MHDFVMQTLLFSCSRFKLIAETFKSVDQKIPFSYRTSVHVFEDQFEQGLEKIIPSEFDLQIETPPKGLGKALYKAYSMPSVSKDYILHLEDDWIFFDFPDHQWCLEVLKKRELDQLYLSSKLSWEEAEARWGRAPDYSFGQFCIYCLTAVPENEFCKRERSGHLLPNITPHIGRPGLFQNYVDKINLQPNFDFASIQSPARAWKFWLSTLLPNLKIAIIFRKTKPFIFHTGDDQRHRVRYLKP